MKVKAKEILTNLRQYFNLMADKEDEQQVIEQVSAGVVFRGTNLWILIFAIFIASLGLNVNSTAVIIGAMLISPLMGPIIGMGLSVGIGDYDLLRRALKNYLVATVISVITAAIYFFISPLSEAQSELLARTSPTLYDVMIAFFGGAAGVLALTTKSKGQVIPGVAIATALMPPLCTAGYGLATAQWQYFLGAFYLFFINTVFIAVSTFLGVKLLRFHNHTSLTPEAQVRGRRMVWVVVIVTMLPAAVMTIGIVKDNVESRSVRQFVNKELSQNGTQILSTTFANDTLSVVAVGRTISDAEIADARSRMGYYGLQDCHLEVIQGTDSKGLEDLTAQLTSRAATADADNLRLTSQIGVLEQQLSAFTALDSLAPQLMAEAATLFPEVQSLALAKASGTGQYGACTVAIVESSAPTNRKAALNAKLQTWLQTRMADPTLKVLLI